MQYLIPAILTLVVGLIVGLILWAIKRERLSLVYDMVESEIFPRQTTSGKYFVCTLRNAGNRPIQDISYVLRLGEGKIDSVEFSDSKLIQLSGQEDNALEGTVSLLNPHEELGAVVTITEATKESMAKLEARAIGATARQRSKEALPGYVSVIGVVLAMAAAGTAGFASWTSYVQVKESRSINSVSERVGNLGKTMKKLEESAKARDKEIEEMRGGKPVREHEVFAILNKTGLGFMLPSLLASGNELPFWKTGLHMMHTYLTDKKDAKKFVDALDQLSGLNDIAPASKGFLLYLTGKIEQDQGNAQKAMEYFEKCKKEAPLMYDHLMAQDPAYDLRVLERVVTGALPNRPIKPSR